MFLSFIAVGFISGDAFMQLGFLLRQNSGFIVVNFGRLFCCLPFSENAATCHHPASNLFGPILLPVLFKLL